MASATKKSKSSVKLVKDQLTGEKIDKKTAFAVQNGVTKTGKPTFIYYGSEDAYNAYKKNLEYKDMCCEKIKELLGYEDWQQLSTIWFKKLNSWKDYGYAVVYECMLHKTETIEFALRTKSFKDETLKVQYVCAIIVNGLNDTYKKCKANNETKTNTEVYIEQDIEISNNSVQKKKDIRKFLEDD